MEILLYLAICSGFLFLSKNWHSNSSKFGLKTVIIVLLFGFMIASQVQNDHTVTYPFTNWGMYSNPNPAKHYKEYILVHSNGEEKHYPFSLINKINQRPFMRKASDLEDEFLRSYGSNDPSEISPVEELVEQLIAIYSEKYPEEEVESFKINVVSFDFNSQQGLEFERFTSYSYLKR